MGFHYWYRTVKENRNLVNRKKSHAFNKENVKDGYPKKKIKFRTVEERIIFKNRMRIQDEIALYKRRRKIVMTGSIVIGILVVIDRYGHYFW